jgi:DNA-binding CsgD family transcriptional regulator
MRSRKSAQRSSAIRITTREIADRLFIAPKTADRHIQHIYGKIGTSTRAAAALWAMQHAGVSRPPERRAPVRYSLSLWECHTL